MSEAQSHGEVLSRDELAALLESLEEGKQRDLERQTVRPVPTDESFGMRTELARIAEEVADEQGRSLSTHYQTPISFEVIGCEELAIDAFGAAMMPTDRVVRLEVGPQQSDCYLLFNRPLVFGWMGLAFGAAPGEDNVLVPARPYTRIEERFLRRAAVDVILTLSKTLGVDGDSTARSMTVMPPANLDDASNGGHWVASFEVSGLGELCRMRVALPRKLLEPTKKEPAKLGPPGHLEGEILNVSTDLSVAIGYVEATLSQVAALKPGDQLVLNRFDPDALVVNVEGKPKFRAESGTLDRKIAVRILEAL